MIDVNALLQPISDTSPAGEDISFSLEFDQIQEARRSDDASLDQGEWVTEIKQADWPLVLKQCTALLTEKSKDLRLAAWLAEAATHLYGFQGLATGYQLIAGLCEHFWDSLHPEIEDGDTELRVGNLSWMLSQSKEWMYTIPLTQIPERNFTALDIDAAIRSNDNSTGPTMADIERARTATPIVFYQKIAESLPIAKNALSQLESIIDEKLGDDGPSFSTARETFEKVAANANRLINAAGAQIAPQETTHETSEQTEVPSEDLEPNTPQIIINSGAINSRNEALLQLQRVADYFKQTEPHSPVIYLAERAVEWGNMPLHSWLQAVLKEESGALNRLEELLGFSRDEETY
ncbi:type VI secretion protein [Thiopseudomonas alkaliphila]|uniref:type VI secretion system protein TssA n=1 Tax=Thiopseudomonas alkaliphila TaxID=1697053 RepID=UPI00069CD595|nr:type VI secretion system protein TssA [Thiopseudomonas alkaliphila]AKX44183.1 type VI secretion protein [Thiopseudomonas alkaliphila]